MSGIRRKLPISNLAREKALNSANTKIQNLPISVQVLTAVLMAALNSLALAYTNASDAVSIEQAILSSGTVVKNEAVNQLKMFVSHFIQVFNLGVARGWYLASHRLFYKLDQTGTALPDLGTEADVIIWAQRLISGDAHRIAAGGAAMANPPIADVVAKLTLAEGLLRSQSTQKDVLDAAQEVLDNLNEEADLNIRQVWDCIEAYFGGESNASRRANSREFGVIYVRDSDSFVVTGILKSGGVPAEAVPVTLVDSGASSVSNHEGRFAIRTTLTGEVTLRVEPQGKPAVEVKVIIEEDIDVTGMEVPEIEV